MKKFFILVFKYGTNLNKYKQNSCCYARICFNLGRRMKSHTERLFITNNSYLFLFNESV